MGEKSLCSFIFKNEFTARDIAEKMKTESVTPHCAIQKPRKTFKSVYWTRSN
jgi:hypothetical protein